MQRAPSVPVLAGSLICVVSSIASTAGAEPLVPQTAQAHRAHAPAANSPAANSPAASRPAGTQGERSEPQSPTEQAPERVSLRIAMGVGGGNVGIAARVAGDVEYWLLDHVGLGVLGALGGQSAMFGGSFSYAFVGPALMLRDRAAESGFFATAAFGLVNGGYTRTVGGWLGCDGVDCSVRHAILAPGVVLDAGLTGRAGSVDLGAALAVDLISAQLESPRWLNTVTLNFIVGFPLL